MAKTKLKAKTYNEKKSKVSKSLLKSKLKQKSKHTKAQIEKLDKDLGHVSNIHAELVKKQENEKKVNALDAKSLRADLQRDEKVKMESKKAENDLAGQLELITGISL